MKITKLISIASVAALLLPACSTPTLVEIARRRQVNYTENGDYQKANHGGAQDDVNVKYHITDWDVLNYTDEVERKLANRGNIHTSLRYGSATSQATLAALAGAAKTFGWTAGTASGFGMGATYLFGLGQIFDAKDHAQAYESAFTAIDKAESTYYLHQVGYKIDTGTNGKPQPVSSGTDNGDAIPNRNRLTFDGETLYYRVIKTLKVLDDALAQRIPNLQDLKDSQGDSSAPPPSPVNPLDKNPGNGGTNSNGTTTSGGGGASASSSNSGAGAANGSSKSSDPLVLRNARLKSVFVALSDDEATKLLAAQGESPQPPGTPPKEYLAEVICSRASLAKRSKQSWVQSLTFYRANAVDEASTAKLEEAYRKYSLLPSNQ